MKGRFSFKDCEVRRMKLSDLRPAEYNPRTITDEAFERLGNSMDRFGLLIPIVWNERSGNIVGGHQRYRHLVETGEEETDVVVVDLDDQEEVALNITLNSPKVRGHFTREVLDALRMTEAKLGSAFNDLGLNDLFRQVSKIRFPNPDGPTGKTDSGNDGGGEPPPPSPPSPTPSTPPEDEGDKPHAIITCPKCKSRWQMEDEKVVFNAMEGSGGVED